MAELSKTPVVCRDDYIMFLEYFNDLLWFHTDVRKWTPKVKAKFLEDLNLLIEYSYFFRSHHFHIQKYLP